MVYKNSTETAVSVEFL